MGWYVCFVDKRTPRTGVDRIDKSSHATRSVHFQFFYPVMTAQCSLPVQSCDDVLIGDRRYKRDE